MAATSTNRLRFGFEAFIGFVAHDLLGLNTRAHSPRRDLLLSDRQHELRKRFALFLISASETWSPVEMALSIRAVCSCSRASSMRLAATCRSFKKLKSCSEIVLCSNVDRLLTLREDALEARAKCRRPRLLEGGVHHTGEGVGGRTAFFGLRYCFSVIIVIGCPPPARLRRSAGADSRRRSVITGI
jgi:hypothetical protein